MPKLQLTAEEAAALKRRRARNKAHNASVTACLDVVKKRLKGADALQAATLSAVLQDLRRLIR